jgi:hypothetical protein
VTPTQAPVPQLKVTSTDTEFGNLDNYGSFFPGSIPKMPELTPQTQPPAELKPRVHFVEPPMASPSRFDLLKSPGRVQVDDDAESLLKQWEERRKQLVQDSVEETLKGIAEKLDRTHIQATDTLQTLQSRTAEYHNKITDWAIKKQQEEYPT